LNSFNISESKRKPSRDAEDKGPKAAACLFVVLLPFEQQQTDENVVVVEVKIAKNDT
jgi:hypothetical protein